MIHRLQYKALHMFDTPFEVLEGLAKVAIEDGVDVMQFHNPERCVHHPQGYYERQDIIDGYYERIKFIDTLIEKYRSSVDIWNIWNPIRGSGPIGLPGMNGVIFIFCL